VTLNPVIEIDGVELHLARPVEEIPPWIGQREVLLQLLASWSLFAEDDAPLNPRLLGKPGVGKTARSTLFRPPPTRGRKTCS
jgi:MoxR-like ATPase